ncbi:MAG TPA: hypothetical protein VKD90_21710 [Gemmataceae bacterium]|nr:hypothetical protein [Gemmataceae bacterium]
MYYFHELNPVDETTARAAIEAAGGGWVMGREPGLMLSDMDVTALAGVAATVTPLTKAEADECVRPGDTYGGAWAGATS